MAEDKSVTPEQQLLKLIEGQKSGNAGDAPGPENKSKKAGVSAGGFLKAPGALLAKLAFWKRRSKKRSLVKRTSPFGIREVNRALVVGAALLFVYVVFDAVASARNLQRPPNFAPVKDAKTAAKEATVAPLEEAFYFLQKVSSRDIFKEGKKEPVAPVQTAPTEVNLTESAEAVKNLALVGISWSSNPDAIIEDKSKQRTYFVKRGQEVGDGVKVEAIFKDHVVVTFEDREYELR